MSEKDAATILEEAADIILIRGVQRNGGYGVEGGPRCTVGAITEAAGGMCNLSAGRSAALTAVYHHVHREHGTSVPVWNDATEDDDEVRDTLLLVAKQFRAEAKP